MCIVKVHILETFKGVFMYMLGCDMNVLTVDNDKKKLKATALQGAEEQLLWGLL